ncbi:tyrosine-protein kinase Fer-like [Centruroides vittatus]|uniref:tyrosine-protein kinase Fer-like n=1 Tax=Centruroides vittatus TaxID=120091 RepID=UPI00350F70F9
MGFAADMQEKASHEALVALQDAELRLLENMKKCLTLRIKCDRDYANALNSVCIQAQKTDAITELEGSLIAKAWCVITEETERLSRLMQENTDHLVSNTLESFSHLILEKRALKNVYVEEHLRICGKLTQLQESVNKTRNEYEKSIDLWKIARAKYEDQYIKGKHTKKLTEAKERYQKLTKKLHHIHNDYILLLGEATKYERDFRTTLLLSLLEYQQSVLQESVVTWKNVLRDFAQYTNLSRENFQTVHTRIKESIEAIIASQEYTVFIDKNRSSPIAPVEFKFDEYLLDDYTGKLKPNQLIIDDYTYDNLKERLGKLSEQLAQCRADLIEKENQLFQCEKEISNIELSSDLNPMITVKQRAIDILKREIGELRCREERLQRQWEVIDIPLSSLGPNGPPPGLELDDGLNEDQREESPSLSSFGRKSARLIMSKLRHPFHTLNKKNSPESPSPTDEYRQCCTGSSSGSDPITSYHGSNLMLSVPHKNLQEEEWFHGVLPREEVVRLLVNDGDFLVRETTRNDERQIVVSVCWKGHKHFIVQTTFDGKYRFEGPAFSTIQELINYQHQSGHPITSRSGAILANPVHRERWELSNDDVELIDKIGRGNFGDVYKAVLHPTGIEVAVKTCRVNLPDEQKRKFLQEGRILKQYSHPNIVKFIGICVQKQPVMIVMELVPGGSLLNFLRLQGVTLTVPQLIAMCTDTAAGMEYLESKNCIHRDLAARNCLVGYNNNVKISDFGMSREEEEYIVSDGMKQIPIKWTAPEALNFGKYTSLCDVWSYGVLMWEIFSLGSTPYYGLTNSKARELIDSGYRLPSPESTPVGVYELMLRCWEYNPERRPHFQEIRMTLENITSNMEKFRIQI